MIRFAELSKRYNFIRVASSAPELRVADVDFNVSVIASAMKSAAQNGASIIVFPELSLTGYSCGDLFNQTVLLNSAESGLGKVASYSENYGIQTIIGLPVAVNGRLYNCAAFISKGRILGLVPKSFLPARKEFYETRWFTSGFELDQPRISIANQTVSIGNNILFTAENIPDCTIGIEICEDLWAVEPPSGVQAIAGATILFNLSASNELLGKQAYRKDLVRMQSARCLAAYVYASSGPGESSTDLVYSGHCIIAENGVILSESERFHFDSQLIFADIDLERIRHDRLTNSSFSSSAISRKLLPTEFVCCYPSLKSKSLAGSLRPNSSRPFVPTDLSVRASTCREIFSLQSAGLAKRLSYINTNNVVIGVSGGLDSTLALLVAVHAFDYLAIPRNGILALIMPGLGTSTRTRKNAEGLVKLVDAEMRIISINAAIKQHFSDIDHDDTLMDVTYENSQARERTQILMDVANQSGGFVVGTGDLSEAALGWCTFNADHMSMYHVNIGVPKTLVKYIIEWCAEEQFPGPISEILHDICNTPITPELLPVTEGGEIQQLTEDVVGPYELHDYFLFHMVRYGYGPDKILYLAEQAFRNRYQSSTILHWLEIFIRRFFSQQFKRSVMPDGPKVGSVALSPRGDWRMPSDASVTEWIKEIEKLRSLKEGKINN